MRKEGSIWNLSRRVVRGKRVSMPNETERVAPLCRPINKTWAADVYEAQKTNKVSRRERREPECALMPGAEIEKTPR